MQEQALVKLFGRYGWGSVLVETQFALYNQPYDFIEVGDLFQDPEARAQVGVHNALGQVPTLLLPDGRVMTESAAITLWLADQHNSTLMVPGAQEAERASFLRWLICFVTTLYPTYTYSDDPARFVHHAVAQQDFVEAVRNYAKKAFLELERVAQSPWFLGARFSALDLYVTTFSHWQPGSNWFLEHTPRLFAIRKATKALPALNAIWQKNFPKHIGA
jgi:GST-like protein